MVILFSTISDDKRTSQNEEIIFWMLPITLICFKAFLNKIMTSQPNIIAKIPSKTLIIYITVWVIGCLIISTLHMVNVDWGMISSLEAILDLITAILFMFFACVGIVRLSQKLEVYDDRIVRKNILRKKVTFFKDMNGHYVDDSDNNTLAFAKGYFRGIIIKKKDGSHFSLNKAELTHFDAIKKQLRNRCRYFNNQAIKKQIKKEDRKLYLFLIGVLIILIASLLH